MHLTPGTPDARAPINARCPELTLPVLTAQYAKSGRAKCKAGKSCSEMIPDGELRVGTQVEVPDRGMQTSWRHWCALVMRTVTQLSARQRARTLSLLQHCPASLFLLAMDSCQDTSWHAHPGLGCRRSVTTVRERDVRLRRKCVTDRVLKNIIGKAGGPEGMQGFDELDNDAQVCAASTEPAVTLCSSRTGAPPRIALGPGTTCAVLIALFDPVAVIAGQHQQPTHRS